MRLTFAPPQARRALRSWASPRAPRSSASAAAPAAPTAGATSQAGHTCLVMTGSGDPAFVGNFNPYTATGLPDRASSAAPSTSR